MAISKNSPPPFENSDDRQTERRRVRLRVHGANAVRAALVVEIRNISATGMLIACDAGLRDDERIEIDLPNIGSVPAAIIWSSGNLFGCQFDTPLSPATLSAAQLRSDDHGPRRDVEARDSGDGDTAGQMGQLGSRLRRLRIAKGLSQSYVAEQLGVSGPSISGWEKGRARPKHDRLEALADLLGISLSQLLIDGKPEPLRDMVREGRERIARAAGVRPDQVRIVIDF